MTFTGMIRKLARFMQADAVAEDMTEDSTGEEIAIDERIDTNE